MAVKDNHYDLAGTAQGLVDEIELTPGPDGLSAYEVAVENGFEGNEAAWLASLVGPQGEQGIQGETGATGPEGPAGSLADFWDLTNDNLSSWSSGDGTWGTAGLGLDQSDDEEDYAWAVSPHLVMPFTSVEIPMKITDVDSGYWEHGAGVWLGSSYDGERGGAVRVMKDGSGLKAQIVDNKSGTRVETAISDVVGDVLTVRMFSTFGGVAVWINNVFIGVGGELGHTGSRDASRWGVFTIGAKAEWGPAKVWNPIMPWEV